MRHEPSDSQRDAIRAESRPLLVVAGPGAGKTFCLIERIRYVIEHHGVAADSIVAFTFTNKAAEEIASSILHQIGSSSSFLKDQLQKFARHRLRGDTLSPPDQHRFERYEETLLRLAGAEPKLFERYVNNFGITRPVSCWRALIAHGIRARRDRATQPSARKCISELSTNAVI